MNDPIDADIARLSAMATPPALDGLEAGVFAAIDERARSRTVGLWSVAGALAIGLAGGGLIAGSAAPAQAATPFGIDGGLAPSTLLLGR